MIRISTLKTKGAKAVVFDALPYGDFVFGPFPLDRDESFETIEFRSSFDSLQGRPGPFGENHVNHRELHIDAEVGLSTALISSGRDGFLGFLQRPSGDYSSTNKWFDVSKFDNERISARDSRTLSFRLSPTRLVYVKLPTIYYTGVSYEVRTVYTVSVYDFVSHDSPGVAKMTLTTLKSSVPMKTSSSVRSERDSFFALTAYQNCQDEPYSDPIVTPTSCTPYYSKEYFTLGKGVPTPGEIYRSLFALTELHYDIPEVKTHGDLAASAIGTLDANSVNMFEFLQGIKNPKQLLLKLSELRKLKTHASNYLAVQYGVLPTLDDLVKLKDALLASSSPYYDSNNYQILTSGHEVSRVSHYGTVTVINRLKLAVNPKNAAMHSLSERLRHIGGFPSVDNLWDLVPYSFVIDWFLNIGDLLEAQDTRFRLAHLPVVYSTVSTKMIVSPVFPKALQDLRISGTCSFVYYTRTPSTKAPSPTLSFEVSNELPNHWLEAGSLIVVARK